MRIVGIDVARAIALIAMVAAHLTVTGANTLGMAGQLLYGFPAALFAFLAGISMGLMRPHPVTFLVRGLILIFLHFVLVPFAGTIEVVLLPLGLSMMLLAFIPSWSTPRLAAVGIAAIALSATTSQLGGIFGAPYPLAMWVALMVAGMLFNRIKSFGGAVVVGVILAIADLYLRMNVVLPFWLDANGHTGGVVDVVGSIGMSAAVVGMCRLLYSAIPASLVLQPMGSMTLTLYCLHIVTSEYLSFVVTVVAAAVIAVVWKHFFKRGPLETVVANITKTAKENYETRTHSSARSNG
ncbi:DUF418 domain-containing protein [Corynebacterium tuscaniense]|uniref:DUF418 domain-containing protein n=1 Tax=Corynebacterium tuscaniense TaxID=302449 RepID=UPI00123996E2|nr:DUF418 domain-containing protein [Corynebacterium tuscaniense]KAA8746721.1 DUF418 domain-containing protein [Corynebacterium tuscaniense]